jgi:hypothetical protein
MEIKLGRYKTRDGRDARVICVDKKSEKPIVALALSKDGFESTHHYHEDGRLYDNLSDSDLDLIPLPELEFDWSVLPAWANYISMDTSGKFAWWNKMPAVYENGTAFQPKREGNLYSGTIPNEYKPIYNGDKEWAIFERPKP